ncbi:MAG: dipeptidase [Longimicrobiales bacterium]|nr:dipeptidase [Longimicrobiales bacterium]
MTRRTRRIVGLALGALLLAALLAFGVVPGVLARRANRTLDGATGPVSAEAARIQATLVAADLHADALLWDRDLLRRGSWGHVDVPRLIEGHVALQAFTVVTKVPRNMNIVANTGDSDDITLLAVLEAWPPRTWGSLTERALHQAAKLHRFAADSGGRLAIVRTREELRGFLQDRDPAEESVAGFLGLEGAHALEDDLANVDRLSEAGFRMFGLTHFFDNEVGASAHGVSGSGLSEFGGRVLDRMEELGIAADLAHASPALIDDVLARATRPVLVSHTGVKGTCDNQRNLDDRRLAAIAATGGVVGIGLWETALCGVTPADWARAVRHAADAAGVDHVGIGSDWDGAVTAILDASQTVHLTQALLDQGFSEEEIRKIMGGNVVRVLLETLPSRGGR